MKVADRHRLDVAPEAIEGAPVDAGEQAAIAPLHLLRVGGGDEGAAQGGPRQLDLGERPLHVGAGELQPLGEDRRRGRTAEGQPGPHQVGEGSVAIRDGGSPPGRRLADLRDEAATLPGKKGEGPSLGRHPERRGGACPRRRRHEEASGPPVGDQPLEQGGPAAGAPLRLGQATQVEQEVVQLVGGLDPGLGLLDHRGHRLRVERPQALDDLGGQPAPDRDRPRAPLLQRRVVEESVGVRVEDLVGERRGLGHVPRQPPDPPRRQLDENSGAAPRRRSPRRGSRGRSPPPAGGRAPRSRPRRGCPGRRSVRGTPPPAGPGPASAAGWGGSSCRLAGAAGQRAGGVPAPAGLEHRRLQNGLGQHLVDVFGAHQVEDAIEGEAVLRARARGGPRRRWRRPAARSRSCGRSACAGPCPRRG